MKTKTKGKRKRIKKGGEGTLNSHIENYIKAQKVNDQNSMDKHKTLYINAYARHMGVPKMIEKKRGFGLMPSKNVINPKIQASFDKRLQNEKNAQKDAYELEKKRQDEIIERNLRNDKIKQMNRMNMERSGAFDENVTPQEKKAASNRFIQMRKQALERGPSTLRRQNKGGKRKTRKHKKKTRKSKKRKVRKNKKTKVKGKKSYKC
tara:strand:- start:443 stop:1060 length:618 start_codon:yes stop_codon:yes gene_type:complete